jgi:hypothetical protein
MKKFTIICMMIFGVLSSFAQTPVPNFGFENWINFNQPNDWLVRGITASQSTDKYAGNYALKLQTNIVPGNHDGDGMINTLPPNGTEGAQPAFSVSARHSTLNGFYKFTPLNGDSCQFSVAVYKHGYVNPNPQFGNTLGYGSLCKSTSSIYAPFTVTIQYYDSYAIPDSAYISLTAFKSFDVATMTINFPLGNSTLYVDNLSFDGFILNGINTINNAVKEVNIFPNPATDLVTLKVNNTNYEDIELKIYTVIGELVRSKLLKQNNLQVNIGDLNNGIYMVEIKSKEWSRKEKLIIQR